MCKTPAEHPRPVKVRARPRGPQLAPRLRHVAAMSRPALAWAAFLVGCTAVSAAAGAAEAPADNAISLELLGPGGAYSFGYERLVDRVTTVRLGVSYLPTADGDDPRSRMFMLPLSVAYLPLASGQHALEIGGAGTLVVRTGHPAPEPALESWWSAFAGYRRTPLGAGVQFRVGICVLVGRGMGTAMKLEFDGPQTPATSYGVLPLPYLSVGAGF
jgi:hypothetical protein